MPSVGWVIFGGSGGSRLLESPDADWQPGPEIYMDQYDLRHCLVQVKSATLMFNRAN